MKDIFMLFLIIIASVPALLSGIYEFSKKNFSGGIFIFFLSFSVIFLGIYVLIAGNA